MFTSFNPFAGRKKGRSYFWIGIQIGALVALFIWWWIENQPRDAAKKPASKPVILPPDEPHKEPSAPTNVAAPSQPDDLQKIEGLGPKASGLLQELGFTSFAQLAAMQPDQLKLMLTEAGMRIVFPDTWPEQATLAATGKWDELSDLQGTLKGGRRI